MAYLRSAARAAYERRQTGTLAGNQWPQWEMQSPQYPVPNAYNLAQLGYRKDELVFSCIDYRMQTVSEPRAKLYRGQGKEQEEIGGLFDSFPNRCVNSEMGEYEFWAYTEMYRLITGNAIWEIETNRIGEPINLWPLNPAYCGFKRGNNRPLDKITYIYPGLEPQDIPRERLIVFQEPDPIYPMLKGLSRTAIAMRSLGVHTSTTDFLSIFFQRGAVVQGYLKYTQQLSDPEAERAKKRWRDAHGGAGNWGENNIAILGQGADYQKVGTDFKDMAFEQIDGRTESLICMVFGISPLLIEAKVGLGAVTDTNFTNVEKKYYNRVCKPSWRWYAGEMTQQLCPLLDESGETYCEFDLAGISALTESENDVWRRANEAAKANILTRDEARAELGYDPIDAENKVFVGVTVSGITAPAEAARVVDPELDVEALEAKQEEAQAAQLDKLQQAREMQAGPNTTTTTAGPGFSEPTDTAKFFDFKGDVPGHEFHGNQWTGGGGGSGGSNELSDISSGDWETILGGNSAETETSGNSSHRTEKVEIPDDADSISNYIAEQEKALAAAREKLKNLSAAQPKVQPKYNRPGSYQLPVTTPLPERFQEVKPGPQIQRGKSADFGFSEPTTTEEAKYFHWRKSALLAPGSTVGAPFDAELEHCTTKTQTRGVFEAHHHEYKTTPELSADVAALTNFTTELRRYNDAEARRVNGAQRS